MQYQTARITIPETHDEYVARALFRLASFPRASIIYFSSNRYFDENHRKLGSRCVATYWREEPEEEQNLEDVRCIEILTESIKSYITGKREPRPDLLVIRISKPLGFFESRKRGGACWERTDEYHIEFSEKINPELIPKIGEEIELIYAEEHANPPSTAFMIDPIYV